MLDEFAEFLNQANLALVMGLDGLRASREQWEQRHREAIVKTEPISFGGYVDGDLFVFQSGPLNDVVASLAEAGSVARFLGSQWVTSVFEHWEQLTRPAIADGLGVGLDDVKDELLGDLRRIRNDVVHHRGVATKDNSGKCDVLSQWVSVGDPVHVGTHHVREFMSLLSRSQGGYVFPATDPRRLEALSRASHEELFFRISRNIHPDVPVSDFPD